MKVKKFLSFISFVGVISFGISNIAGAAGPYNKAPEFTKASETSRIGAVGNSEKDSSEDLKENTNLDKKGLEEQSLPGNQSSEISKDTSASSSDEKRSNAPKVALISVLAIFTLLVLGVVAINIKPKDVENISKRNTDVSEGKTLGSSANHDDLLSSEY